MEPTTSLFRISFAIGTDRWGRRLITSTVVRAESLEAAQQAVIDGSTGIPVAADALAGYEEL